VWHLQHQQQQQQNPTSSSTQFPASWLLLVDDIPARVGYRL
jgi:hypothetical protein